MSSKCLGFQKLPELNSERKDSSAMSAIRAEKVVSTGLDYKT